MNIKRLIDIIILLLFLLLCAIILSFAFLDVPPNVTDFITKLLPLLTVTIIITVILRIARTKA